MVNICSISLSFIPDTVTVLPFTEKFLLFIPIRPGVFAADDANFFASEGDLNVYVVLFFASSIESDS